MLNKVAEHLRAFLRWTLPQAMKYLGSQLRHQLPYDDYHNFDFDMLQESGMLRVLRPIAVRGFTFWLGLKRRRSDETYDGLILIWNVLYIHFTRASDRLYILMEDLRDLIPLPKGG